MSERESTKEFEENYYDVTLGYLKYDTGQADKLSFPIQVRERHLTQGPTPCTLQGIGPELQVCAWSERDNILIRLPLTKWRTTGVYENKLSGPNNGHLSVGRFSDILDTFKADEDEYHIAGFLYVHDWERSQ